MFTFRKSFRLAGTPSMSLPTTAATVGKPEYYSIDFHHDGSQRCCPTCTSVSASESREEGVFYLVVRSRRIARVGTIPFRQKDTRRWR